MTAWPDSLMTINSSAPTAPRQLPSLDDFASAATRGEAVYASSTGRSLQTLGTGATPSGRTVAWVEPDVDTTRLFTEALAQSHGIGISQTVALELGLVSNPGKPLASRTITQALDMAQTLAQVFSGVDYVTQLNHSAVARGTGFTALCQDMGISAADFTPDQQKRIDQAMREKFEQAAAQGNSPVSSNTAREWLRALIEPR